MDKKIKQNIILILLLINLTATGGLAVYLFAGSESQDAETAVFTIWKQNRNTPFI